MKRDFTKLYCFVDDFIQDFDNASLAITNCKSKPGPANYLSSSETLTIIIGFHQSTSDCFKNYYIHVILADHQNDFRLPSYAHFTKLIGKHLPFLTMLLDNMFKKCTGISFVDSTSYFSRQQIEKIYRQTLDQKTTSFIQRDGTYYVNVVTLS